MTSRIFRSIVTVAAVILCCSLLLIMGVLYGYGSRGELEPFAPLYLAPSAGALRAWLLQRKYQGEAALPEKD